MIKIIRKPWGRTTESKTSCPFCLSSIKFYTTSPVYCPECTTMLPDFIQLIESPSERRAYHTLGITGIEP